MRKLLAVLLVIILALSISNVFAEESFSSEAFYDYLNEMSPEELQILNKMIDEKLAQENATSSNETERMSVEEATDFLEKEWRTFEGLLTDFRDTLEYAHNNTFTTIESIHEYENRWKNLSDTASSIATRLAENAPPEQYDELWLELSGCIAKVATELNTGTNFDTDSDGTYTSAEMNSILNTASKNVGSYAKTALDIIERINNVVPITTITVVERMSAQEADILLEEEWAKFEGILGYLNNTLLVYWKEATFTTIESIHEYENMWKNQSEIASGIATRLAENAPPEQYDELWMELSDCMAKIATELNRGTNFDTNSDGVYNGDEMTELNYGALRNVSSLANEAISISKRFNEIPAPSSESTTGYKAFTKQEFGDKSEMDSNANVKNDTNGSANSSYSTKNSARHTDVDAWACAKNIVKDQLKSPSTADFCSFTDASITHLGNGEYMVVGWVDAQNSFGATVRQKFGVTYTATSQGYINEYVVFE